MAFASALGLRCGVPVVGVNHLRGHLFSPFIGLHEDDPAAFQRRLREHLPHLGLIVSGGNTLLCHVDDALRVTVVAQTVDDAAGEALDKGAKLLGMPYPGGPLIEKAAAAGDAGAFAFPRAFAHSADARFSFSGLKTSLRYQLEKMSSEEVAAAKADLCASYQQAVVDALVAKTGQQLRGCRLRSIGLSGGVANNGRLREAMEAQAQRQRLPLLCARRAHCGDNAAMIAFAAWLDPVAVIQQPSSFLPAWELT
jgi:N6-L-threonylcarbamoyladenine synthase